MDSSFISSSLTAPFVSHFSPPHQNHPNSRQITTKRHSRIRISYSKRQPRFFPPSSTTLFKFDSPEASRTSQCCKKDEKKSILESSRISNQPVISITKSIVYTIACIAIGFTPFVPFKAAIAAPVVVSEKKQRESEIALKAKDPEYSDCTRRLLETVSSLMRVIEEVRGGNGDMERVRVALKAVRERKEQLQDEILNGLQEELGEMKREKDGLVKRGEEIVDEVLKVQWESEKVEGDERAERLERIRRLEEEYGEVWGRVGEIEDAILRRETIALSIGVRELCFIERECQELVRRFERDMKWKGVERYNFDDVLLFTSVFWFLVY